MIQGTDYEGRTMILVRKESGEVMHRGYKIAHGDHKYVLDGGRAPLHYNSSGRIYILLEEESHHNIELFPHVLNLEWVLQADPTRR